MRNIKYKFDKEEFVRAVANNITIAGVLRDLNKNEKSFGHYRVIHRYVKLFQLDTSHWVGLKHNKGKKRLLPCAPINEVLSSDGYFDQKYVKRRIIKDNLLPYICSDCNITEWNGQKLSLHLDHINGINDDHRLENLRFLCPNCHSLTPTYCGKNNKKNYKNKNICKCSNTKSLEAKICKSCNITNKLNKYNLKYPDHNTLILMINNSNWETIARELKVSSSAIRKRLRKFNLIDQITI